MKTYLSLERISGASIGGRIVYTEAKNKNEAIKKMRNAGYNVLSSACIISCVSLEWIKSDNKNILIVE